MSKIGMYVVHDEEGALYDVPFFARDDTFAKRKFYMDLTTLDRSMMTEFKDSMKLYKLGEYDQRTGKIVAEFSLLMDGKNIVRKERDNEVSNGA